MNLENWLPFGKVRGKSRLALFAGYGVFHLRLYVKYIKCTLITKDTEPQKKQNTLYGFQIVLRCRSSYNGAEAFYTECGASRSPGPWSFLYITLRCLVMPFFGCSNEQWWKIMFRRSREVAFQNLGVLNLCGAVPPNSRNAPRPYSIWPNLDSDS